MAMRCFSTVILALLLAGCGRSEAVNRPGADAAVNGSANIAGAANPPDGNLAILVRDNGYSTVPQGNSCGSRTISGPCPGAPTRTCEQIVEGPPCPGR
jgi:hypothetical protein